MWSVVLLAALVCVGSSEEEEATTRGHAVSEPTRGVVYLALGAAAVRDASRSARSVRARENMGILLVTDVDKRFATRWSLLQGAGIFDHVVSSLGELKPAAALAVGLELYDEVVLLGPHTVLCGSLGPLFENLKQKEVAYFRVPSGFEADVNGPILVRNSTAAMRLLAHWRAANRQAAKGPTAKALHFGLYKSKAASLAMPTSQKWTCPMRCGAGCELARGDASKGLTVEDSTGPNGLPNFYLQQSDARYREAPSSFMHVPKAAGNSVKELFVKRYLVKFTRKKIHTLHIDTRLQWDRRKDKDAFGLFYGAFGFGACRDTQPCAHYIIMREPVARMVSEHRYCRSVDFEDQTCTGRLGARGMRQLVDVGDWAEERGNFLLEHFKSLSTLDWAHRTPQGAELTPWHDRDKWTRINPIETRRKREGSATEADLDFVLEHLERWIAVVGITDRFEESMALFSFALTGEQMPREMAGSVHTHNANTSKSDLDPSTLARVEKAVELDTRLYDAACALFERQLVSFRKRTKT